MQCKISFMIAFFLMAVSGLSQDINEKSLRVALSKQVLFGINDNDAKMALTVLLEKYIESENIDYKTEVSLYDGLDKLIEEHKKNPFEVIFVLSPEYLYLKNKIKLKPYLASSRKENLNTSYNLLVNKNSKIKSVKDLEQKSIEFFSNPALEFSLTYRLLNKLCSDVYNKPAKDVFSSMNLNDNPHSSVLKVFFNNVDACLIEEYHFEVICELNPQLRKEINVIYITDEFVSGLACITPFIEDQELFLEKSLAMSKTIYGKQFLDIFKISSAFPVTEKDLESLELLFKEFNFLSEK